MNTFRTCRGCWINGYLSSHDRAVGVRLENRTMLVNSLFYNTNFSKFQFAHDYEVLHFGKGELGPPACQISHTGSDGERVKATRRKRNNTLFSWPSLWTLHCNQMVNKSPKMTDCWGRVQLNRGEESDQDEDGLRWDHSSTEVRTHQRPPCFQVTSLNKAMDWIPQKILFKMSPAWPRENKADMKSLKLIAVQAEPQRQRN